LVERSGSETRARAARESLGAGLATTILATREGNKDFVAHVGQMVADFTPNSAQMKTSVTRLTL
jgi:hypothetical protein